MASASRLHNLHNNQRFYVFFLTHKQRRPREKSEALDFNQANRLSLAYKHISKLCGTKC